MCAVGGGDRGEGEKGRNNAETKQRTPIGRAISGRNVVSMVNEADREREETRQRSHALSKVARGARVARVGKRWSGY